MEQEFHPNLIERFPELRDPDKYFPGRAREMLNIIHVNPEDEGLARAAIRIARSVMANEAGRRKGWKGAYQGILVGTDRTDFEGILDELGFWYVGSTLPDMPTWTSIDGLQFTEDNIFRRAQLIGPKQLTGEITPLLFRDAWARADRDARTGSERELLEDLFNEVQAYIHAYTGRINNIPQEEVVVLFQEQLQDAMQRSNRFRQKLDATYQRVLDDVDDEENPLRGVIAFLRVDRMHPVYTAEMVAPILQTGLIQTNEGSKTFQDAIILLTIEVPADLLRGSFHRSLSSQDRYQRVREYLRQIPHMRPLLKSVGDQVIVVGDPTAASQLRRAERRLQSFANKVLTLDVEARFADALLDYIVEASSDPDAPNVFLANRVDDLVDRYVEIPFAGAVLRGEVFAHSMVTFDAPGSDDEAGMLTVTQASENDEVLTGIELSQAFERRKPDMTEQALALHAEYEELKTQLDELANEIETTEVPETDDDDKGLYL